MICPDCHGRGFVPTNYTVWHVSKPITTSRLFELCGSCHGFGIVHCCDGLTAANEIPADRIGRPSSTAIDVTADRERGRCQIDRPVF